MPKIRKETIDEIRRLGGEGYTNTEIAEVVGVHRDTVRKYRVGANSPIVLGNSGGLSLDEGVLKRLYEIQGIMGASSVADAVERMYRDEVAAMKFKLTLGEVLGQTGEEFSIEGMVRYFTDRIGDLEVDNRLYEKSRAEVAELMERSKVVYNEANKAGYERGKRDHAITYRCAGCGKSCLMRPNGDDHKYVVEVLAEERWGHSACVRQIEYERGAGSRALETELGKYKHPLLNLVHTQCLYSMCLA